MSLCEDEARDCRVCSWANPGPWLLLRMLMKKYWTTAVPEDAREQILAHHWFWGCSWGNNGPQLLLRMLMRKCWTTATPEDAHEETLDHSWFWGCSWGNSGSRLLLRMLMKKCWTTAASKDAYEETRGLSCFWGAGASLCFLPMFKTLWSLPEDFLCAVEYIWKLILSINFKTHQMQWNQPNYL